MQKLANKKRPKERRANDTIELFRGGSIVYEGGCCKDLVLSLQMAKDYQEKTKNKQNKEAKI